MGRTVEVSGWRDGGRIGRVMGRIMNKRRLD